MIRGTVATIGLGAVLLFGYFYLASPADKSSGDRARDAGQKMVEATRDKGAAVVVQAKLTSSFGIDAMRLVHVHLEHGKALVYGLVPAGIDEAAMIAAVRSCPGVQEAELMLQPRPAFIEPLKSIQLNSGASTAADAGAGAAPLLQP